MKILPSIPSWVVTMLLLLAILVLRFPYLSESPYQYDSWRQADTESVARLFVEQRFNIMYPQFRYQGPLPNYVQLEFQIVPFLIAVLYQLFGYHYALARMVPVCFFVGSALFVYLIARRFYGRGVSWTSLAIYGVLPLNLLYARAIMPESAALFFYTGAFYLFCRWMKEENILWLLAAAMFTGLSISEKLPTVFVGLSMLGMALVKYRLRMFVMAELWIFALLALAPPFWYYFYWSKSIAEFSFVSGIAAKHIFPNMASALFSQESIRFFVQELPAAFNGCVLVLFVIGLVQLQWKTSHALGLWALAMLLELVTIVAVIRFGYYLIFLGPILAIVAAAGLGLLGRIRLRSFPIGWMVVVVGIVWLSWDSWQYAKPIIADQDTELLKQAQEVRKWTSKEELIVVGMDDPSLLNASERIGWRVGNSMPEDLVRELKYFVSNGAHYFVPLRGYIDGDTDGQLRKFLDEHYVRVGEGEYYMYRLD